MNKYKLRSLLKESDAEFLLEEVRRGKYKLRVGQVWTMPRLRGTSIILLDYDDVSRVDVRIIRRRCRWMSLQPLRIQCKLSPSKTGYHVFVRVKGVFSPVAVVAIQAILGSDAHREAQNFRRAMMKDYRWRENWNVLFQKRKGK